MPTEFETRLAKITKRNQKIKKTVAQQHWPMEKKIEVVGQFLLLGNMRVVAATTGVAYDTVRKWKAEPFWLEIEAELRQTQNIEMDTKLSKIVEKSLDATLDRVENGDFFYDQKSGELRRRPIPLRDAQQTAVNILTKRELLRGNATERKEVSQISVQEQLKMLASEFAKWQSKPKAVIDVEMVEVLDAVHDEREEGLQEGGGEVHLEASGNQEEDGAERSSSGDDEEGFSPQG